MARLKRSRFFAVAFEDRPVVDLGAFLRGRAELAHETHVSAVSAVARAAHRLSLPELELLASVPARRWTRRSRLAAGGAEVGERLDGLVVKGLLISDADDPDAREMRRREESFESCQWHPFAAFYQLLIEHPGGLDREEGRVIDMTAVVSSGRRAAEDFVARHGPPPPPFHEVSGAGDPLPLPRVEKRGGLYRALARRRTVRAFEVGTPMRAEDLATVLYYVFGCHGHARLSQDVALLHKTSPSGGSLHPVEVYPLIANVAGLATGLYHYRIRDHALVPLRRLGRRQAEKLAVDVAAGHDFAAEAHVLFLMTARFHRNFWKYRRNARTHSVILQDAGHLSQTLYLVCGDLDLGAFYVAFRGSVIEQELGIDGIEEGAVALAGCGVKRSAEPERSLEFLPYVPGEAEI